MRAIPLRDALASIGVARGLVEHAERTLLVRGGGLDTALLEAGAAPSLVAQALEQATGRPSASEQDLELLDAAALERVPAEVAQRCRLVPLEDTTEGLRVAAAAVSAAVAGELLGGPTVALVCPEYRIHVELARRYGLPLAERHAVLAARLLGAKQVRALVNARPAAPRARRTVPPPVARPTPVPPPPPPVEAPPPTPMVTPPPPAVVPPPPAAIAVPPAPAPAPAPAPLAAPLPVVETPAPTARPPRPRVEPDQTPLPAPVPPTPDVDVPAAAAPAPPLPGQPPPPPARRVDYARVVAELEDFDAGGSFPSDALRALTGAGRAGLGALLHGFPGKLVLNRRHPPDARRPVVEHGPRLRALWSVAAEAQPELRGIATDGSSADARWYALALLADTPSPDTVATAGERLFDDDEGVRALAIDLLTRIAARTDHALEPDLKAVRARLRGALGAVSGGGAGNALRRRRAAEALGALRAEDSVADLIAHVGSVDPDLSLAVRRALFTITRHDFGEKEKKWRAWWEKHADKHRIEWLLDAISDDSDETRLLASEELKRLTGEWFGYQFDLPKRDREAARKKWVQWWQDVGRRRFGR